MQITTRNETIQMPCQVVMREVNYIFRKPQKRERGKNELERKNIKKKDKKKK